MLLLVGLVVGAFVRPHMSLLFAVAFGIGLLMGRRADTPGRPRTAYRGSCCRHGRAEPRRRVPSGPAPAICSTPPTSASIYSARARAHHLLSRTPTNPIGYAEGAVTVMFRPLLPEAHGTEALATSLEALFLAALCVVRRRVVAHHPTVQVPALLWAIAAAVSADAPKRASAPSPTSASSPANGRR